MLAAKMSTMDSSFWRYKQWRNATIRGPVTFSGRGPLRTFLSLSCAPTNGVPRYDRDAAATRSLRHWVYGLCGYSWRLSKF